MSLRAALQSTRLARAAPRVASIAIRTSSGRAYSHDSQSSSSSNARFDYRIVAGLAIAAGAAIYSFTPRVHLDSSNAPPMIPYSEVQKHNTRDDCWVVINGQVFDVTEFIDAHPGGVGAIVANAGKDVTKVFLHIHAPDAVDSLDASKHLGPVDPSTLPAPAVDKDEARAAEARSHLPSVDSMLLLSDFEDWAEKVLSPTAWAYYKSAADSEATMDNNAAAFRNYYFRPRILNDITEGDLKTTVVGADMSMPVFISPAAMAKLGHPLGEVNLTRGAGAKGIVQGISINASCSLDQIMEAREAGQKVWFQIYLNRDRSASEKLLKKVTDLGAAAIIFTVDVAWQSKRTRDRRLKAHVAAPIAGPGKSGAQAAGVSAAISGYQDPRLVWDDIKFIRKHTHLPVIVKGVQSIEDVELCAKAGVDGVILSNHGGRSCDYAPAPIDLLYEMRALRPDLFKKIDVMVDGGARSGADVVKALALGAKAVGMGRPFLYANGTHGQEGVERVCEILDEEITNTMRNCGVTKISQLKPEMVGPAGPWVGANRPPWLPSVPKA